MSNTTNNDILQYPQVYEDMLKRIFTVKRLWGIPITSKLYPNVSKDILSKYDYIKK